MRHLLFLLSAATVLSGCEKIVQTPDQPAEAPAPRHVGARKDVVGREGNSFFYDARYTDDGSLLVTIRQDTVRVWDAKTGELRSSFSSQLPEPNSWILDSRGKRFVGRSAKDAFEVFDLLTGRKLVEFPAEERPPNWPRSIKAIALGADTSTVILGHRDSLTLWGMFPPRPLRWTRIDTPEHDFVPRCAGVPENAGKKCWERSPNGRWLALAFTSERSRNEGTRLYLVGTDSLRVRDLVPPDGMWRELEDRSMVGFAFSANSERLAIGTSWGIWVYEIATNRWQTFISGKDSSRMMYGPWLKLLQRGDDKPGVYLSAIGFSSDGSRLVALADGSRSYVFDSRTGHRLGRAEVPPSANWRANFQLSADGSRGIIYRSETTLLEVRDGRDAHQIGWICPTYCEVHQQKGAGALAYAVSPDGRSVAVSNTGHGAAVWATDTDALLFPLNEDSSVP